MKKYLFYILIVIAVGMSSCDDYLSVDSYFREMTQLDSVFARKDLTDEYINGAARFLPNEGNLWIKAPLPFQIASDENFTSRNDGDHAGLKFLRDEITPFSGYYNNYEQYYQGIRKANIALSRIGEVKDISDFDRRDFMGRCYFLRGYYTYLLLLQYGPVPVVPDDPFDMSADTEIMSLERSTYDECVQYICDNMEKAYENLPNSRESIQQINMPDKGAALAVESRILLIGASPWYNGNPFYSDWKRESDEAFFINPTVDNEKWGKAAVAAKRVIDMPGDNSGKRYQLFTVRREKSTAALPDNVSSANFPDGAGNIDPFRSYTYMFNGEVPRAINPEVIYSCIPRTRSESSLAIAAPASLGGINGLNLTQDVIDAFYMADGRDINSSSVEYPYPSVEESYKPIGGDENFSGYTLKSTVAKMYDNREMRFYATIGFCEAFWPGTSYTGSDGTQKNVTVGYYSDGNAAPPASSPLDYNHTGYTCKKYIHPEDQMKSGSVREKSYPIFRFAEILLNYAEALNELEGSYTDPATGLVVNGRDATEILWAFNQIRYRAGLPGLSSLPGREDMRRLIKRERRIEFVCEGGLRYLDVRRWGDAVDAYNRPVRGMNVKARTSNRSDFYTITSLSNDPLAYRSFSYKHYFWPIPHSVMNKNRKLVQNPGW
ncbi:RagB/SusD family nutrient uptake outer membrane protein [Mangrovibacterium marinum]|uniref:RagB/SusD family nutrient uptake outer membrane protein n=1 Tax=Mangrovibacterium marinum TaxID=1639118 RepID=UPI002A186D88|nr:RagB/SusD family nutrient uptake outer membrane protein [Mangrovibacterium marinum]